MAYNTVGRASQVSTTIDGSTYVMGATYDAYSRISKVSYPSGFTARYGYNTLGFANQLSDDATSQAYWTAKAMDAEGHLTQLTSGNGLVTNRTFEATPGLVYLMACHQSRSRSASNLASSFEDGIKRISAPTMAIAAKQKMIQSAKAMPLSLKGAENYHREFALETLPQGALLR